MREHYTEDGNQLNESRSGLITMQSITALDISSTKIRALLNQGLDPNYLVPTSSLKFIQENNLYASAD